MLQRLAGYFNVSTDYLLVITDIRNAKKELTDEDIFTLAAHAEGHEGALSEEDMDNIKMAIKIALAKKNKNKK